MVKIFVSKVPTSYDNLDCSLEYITVESFGFVICQSVFSHLKVNIVLIVKSYFLVLFCRVATQVVEWISTFTTKLYFSKSYFLWLKPASKALALLILIILII